MSRLYFGNLADINRVQLYLWYTMQKRHITSHPHTCKVHKGTHHNRIPPTHKIHPFPALRLAVFSTAWWCNNIISKLQKSLVCQWLPLLWQHENSNESNKNIKVPQKFTHCNSLKATKFKIYLVQIGTKLKSLNLGLKMVYRL